MLFFLFFYVFFLFFFARSRHVELTKTNLCYGQVSYKRERNIVK